MFRITARKRDVKLSVVSIEMELYGCIRKYVTKRCGVKRKKKRTKD